MNKQLKKISVYDEDKLRKYFNKEKFSVLHDMKLYLDDVYTNTGENTGLTDFQYDMLKEIMLERNPEYVPEVGAKVRVGENRVEIPYWMGSMDKIKAEDVNELERWKIKNQSPTYIIEEKLDGSSCLLIVKNGITKLYTRGDGVVGADISYLVQYFESIPKNIRQDIVVRGELIMNKEIFVQKYASECANPRNMVAGRIGGKTARKGLHDIEFVAYELIESELNIELPVNQLIYMKNNLGFKVVNYEVVSEITSENLSELLLNFKRGSEYEMDGLIVQSNRPYIRNDSGNPSYAFAFKIRMDDNLAQTEVIEVEWNVSKWGMLKPRVKVQTVSLGGVTINYASGHNAGNIKDNKIGPGSIVEITRSGDVIPYIVRVIREAEEPSLPDVPYVWNESGVDIKICSYENTMGVKMVSSFFSSMGIKHVSESTVEKLYSSGNDSLLKILAMTEEDFYKIDGFQRRLAERTYQNIHNGLQNVSIDVVLGSAGVFGFGFGKRKMKALFDAIPELLVVYRDMSKKEILDMVMEVEGFSDKTATKIVNNLEVADKFIEDISRYATFKDVAEDIEEGVGGNIVSVNGLKFVISGVRDKILEEKVVSRGGKFVGSVSGNTTCLIVKSKEAKPTGKIKSAMDLGLPIYTVEEFKEVYSL